MALSPDDPRPDHDEPICAACAKPIQSKAAAVIEQGELFHAACRGQLTRFQTYQLVERAYNNRVRAEMVAARAEALRPTRWLVIAAWPSRHTAPDLIRRFEGRAQVLIDRRDRPRATKPPSWSGPERRRPLTEPEDAMWRDFGYRMVCREEKGPNGRAGVT
jgi:hypothetical protein